MSVPLRNIVVLISGTGSNLQSLIQAARNRASEQYTAEVERLRDLAEINRSVVPDEIASLESAKTSLLAALAEATLRVDALKLVLRTAA